MTSEYKQDCIIATQGGKSDICGIPANNLQWQLNFRETKDYQVKIIVRLTEVKNGIEIVISSWE